MNKKEIIDEIIKIVNDTCREEAEKWKGKDVWEQPFAGNRILHTGWEIEKKLKSLIK